MRYQFEDFVFDVAVRELRSGTEVVHVERQVFDVLEALIANADRVMGKAELLDMVWGDQFVSDSALSSRIKSARQAIGDDGRSQRLIKTVHGVGFRFVGPLNVAGDAAPSLTEPAPIAVADRPNLALTIGIDDDFPFVGRVDESERLWALMSDGGGRSGVGLIGGVPGVGKSRFAVELAERAAVDLGAVVAAGRCDREVLGHLQAWRDVVHQLASAYRDDFRRWCQGIEPTIASLGPAVAAVLDQPVSGPVDQHTTSEAIVALLDRVSEAEPTVVVIDDLQWSDEPTRAMISLLARRLAHRPISVLATFRTSHGDLPHDVDIWLNELGRASRAERVDLPGLGQAAVRELTTQVLGTGVGSESEDLFTKTDGHGLFLTELLREMHDGRSSAGMPPSISALVFSRVGRLLPPAQALVMAGAALGVEFRIETAAVVAELDLADALAALDAAIGADLVHEGASVERYRFSHQLVPAALLNRATGPARAALHHRCVGALVDQGAPPVEIAMHKLDSVPLISRDQALTEARQVAKESYGSGYYDQAIGLLDRVLALDLEESVRAEVELDQGAVMNDAGRVPEAIPVFDRAVKRAREADRPDLVMAAAFGRAGRSPYRRVIDTGTLELLGELGGRPDLDRITKARADARTAAFQLNWWRYAQRDELSAEALAAGRAAGASGHDLLELLEARWIAVGCPAGAHHLDALDEELAQLRDELGVIGADAGMPEAAALWFARGDVFRSEAGGWLTVAGKRRNIDYWRHDVLNGTLAVFDGRFEEAAARYDEASHRSRACWGESGPALHGFAHLILDAVSGRSGSGEAGSNRSAALLAEVVKDLPAPIIFACQAWALELNGDREQAGAVLDSISASSLEWFPEHLVGGIGLVAVAEAAVALDRGELADAVGRQLEPLGSLMLGLPWAPSLAAADSLALLAHHRGDAEAEARWRRQAVDVYRSLGAPALIDHLGRF
ncbi:MAG: AAA family ATPase [Acidimicrobiales bacterium]